MGLLAGDQSTKVPLDVTDPCADFLWVLHTIDLKAVALASNLHLQFVVGLHL